MARPTVSAIAELLYSALTPLAAAKDEALDWPLLKFCDALCAGNLERIYDIVRDRDEYPGWVVLLDPDAVPAWALPFAVQFVGMDPESGLTEDQLREKFHLPESWRRGTTTAMVQAAKRTLTGPNPTVLVTQRYLDSAWKMLVRTLVSETPDPAVTEAAIRSQKKRGIVLTYQTVDAANWQDIRDGYSDWADVRDSFTDWLDVKTAAP